MISSFAGDTTEIIVKFVNEAQELIEELEPSIIDLEKLIGQEHDDSSDYTDILNSIFRLFHSVKGGADFLEFKNIVNVTHTAETLLNKIRSGNVTLTSDHIDLLCKAFDFTKDSLSFVQNSLSDQPMFEQANDLIVQFTSPPRSNQSPATAASAPKKPTQPEPASSVPKTQMMPVFDLDITLSDLISPETRKKFIEEAEDLHQEIEEDLLALANNQQDRTPLKRLFRNIHSFKGNCGFMNFKELEQLVHKEETIIDTVKSAKNIQLSPIADTLLELLDIHKASLAAIAEGESGAIEELDLYLNVLDQLLPKEMREEPFANATKIGDILVRQGTANREDINKALDTQNKTVGELLVDSGTVSPEAVNNALKVQQKLKPTATGAAKFSSRRQDIRVDIDKLDNLINLIGEMVIAENMVVHNPDLHGLELENFNKASQHMTKIVRELQEMAMAIRMIPIAGLFKRMIRLVHDLSRKSGKKVDLQISGETTEVDKTVIEKITDPLVHLIRNSMDHGIEDSDDRISTGKKTTGIIQLIARHEEGEILIIIKDDGRGMNRSKLIAKGIEQNLIDGDGAAMTDRQVFQLVFQPGFSTADRVTDISGRGVGMDVVRQNIESIKGRIEIDSKEAKGTTITLRIPLTLAIIEGMLVRTGTSYYIIPILSIRESFQPSLDAITRPPDGQELVKVREHLLPVIRLHELHNVIPDNHDLNKGILVVLETRNNGSICLFVDELMGQQQTVIKGLSNYINTLGNVGGVSGCTILGSGEVCLILDVRSIEEVISTQAINT